LIVGADGRGSQVGRQCGITIEKDVPTHVLGGLLVDDVPDWPTHVHSIGLIGGRRYYVFPQGSGRLRLYLTAALGNRRQIIGEQGNVDFFLRHFDSDSLPHGRSIAAATRAGPLNFYANADQWSDRPIAPGIVLVGDAAGYNDPTIGQGLSIALRDVRLVSEVLLSEACWSEVAFETYVEERRERSRRLRVVAQLICALHLSGGEAAAERRRRVAILIAADRGFAPMLRATGIGPERLPAEAFTAEAVARVLQA
jgi:2-polyprenyl-6-methoxyphenol hydroxylase-like FAD-dependent oxidoreductase